MATLSISERAEIQGIIDRMAASGSARWVDQKSADKLARIFGSTCGFRCGCPGTFLEGLKNAPFLTLLRAMLCGSEGLVVPSSGGEVIIDTPPDGSPPPPVVFPVVASCIDLGTTCTYGVLAGSTITNTGATLISGDLGLWPGTSVTGAPVVTGDTNINNPAAAQAQLDLTAAYDDAAACPGSIPIAGNIGGQTLAPGVYRSASSLEISSGDLILDGGGDVNAEWVFQIGSTLTTTVGRLIILQNGAQARNVYWQVGSSATLGTGSVFKGTILALTANTITTGAVIEGRILARNAAVTLDQNNITTPPCD